MSGWIRKSFSSQGITQIPSGPHLGKVQARLGGTVVLMIDVSGSMDGEPILSAIDGALKFVDEAVGAGYQVGVILWNTGITSSCPPSKSAAAARAVLAPVKSASGGNALDGPLEACHQMLDDRKGDRVVALFGDGDLTPKLAVLAKVALMKSENIRFVTRGLGAHAAAEFAEIDSEDADSVAVESVAELSEGIASMALSLRSSGRSGAKG
jgi:uncharacterized protein (DUF58 family)